MYENTTAALRDEMRAVFGALFSPSGNAPLSATEYHLGMGYAEHLGEPVPVARAAAFAAMLTRTEHFVYDNDIILGSLRGTLSEKLSQDELSYAREFAAFYGDRDWIQGRDHYAPAYDRLLTLGIDGILDEISASRAAHAGDDARLAFLDACDLSMRAFSDLLTCYAANAKRADSRAACLAVAHRAPETFHEALQLVWMAHLVFCMQGLFAMALGRMDQYLYPFYQRDLARGILTDRDAQTLLENVFMKIGERPYLCGGDDVVNICIGGLTPDGACALNALSYTILHAVHACNIPGPNLSARINKLIPDEFLVDCLRVIGSGLGYPALMNDAPNIAALRHMGYEERDANNYCMVGCIENFLPGLQPPWSDGRFDMPKYLEYTLNRGRCMLTDKRRGLDLGDPAAFSSMKEFLAAFETQVRHFADRYTTEVRLENARYNNAYYVNPFMSCLTEHCVERGRDLCDGGTKYHAAHGAGCMGIGTIADALAAIEKTVYLDRSLTMGHLVTALRADFVGYEEVRQLLLDAPKYGNDEDAADKYAVWYVDFLADVFDHYRLEDGGRFYVGIASNTQNIEAGAECAASADGRRAHEPLSDAASPTYGRDTHGPTYTIASLTKPDYSRVALGTVVNQKYSPAAFRGEENLRRMAAMLRVYFKRGGQEMQINSVSRDILSDAMEHPEQYRSLVVRVSGFSAYYTRLDPRVQHDILSRTEQQ